MILMYAEVDMNMWTNIIVSMTTWETTVRLLDSLLVQLQHDPLWKYTMAPVLSGNPCCLLSI